VRCGSKSLSAGQNQDVAHESIWIGTFGRSTSLPKLQSETLKKIFLSSHNPKINTEDDKFVSGSGAPFYQQFKKPVGKLHASSAQVLKLVFH